MLFELCEKPDVYRTRDPSPATIPYICIYIYVYEQSALNCSTTSNGNGRHRHRPNANQTNNYIIYYVNFTAMYKYKEFIIVLYIQNNNNFPDSESKQNGLFETFPESKITF